MTDKTVSWIVVAVFAGAMALMVATGCSAPATAANPAAKARIPRKPAMKSSNKHRICGWGDTGRWECHEATPEELAPEDDWDEI